MWGGKFSPSILDHFQEGFLEKDVGRIPADWLGEIKKTLSCKDIDMIKRGYENHSNWLA